MRGLGFTSQVATKLRAPSFAFFATGGIPQLWTCVFGPQQAPQTKRFALYQGTTLVVP
jgi:hypothetical protein